MNNDNKNMTEAEKWQSLVMLDERDEYLRSQIKGLTPQKYPRLRGTKDRLLHRRIMEPGVGMVVDHINGDKLDNRRSNLRVCTPGQNTTNRKKVHSSSGLKGVFWEKQTKHWKVSIGHNNKSYTLGRYSTKEEAARAYNSAAIKFHGEFAALNEGY